MTVPPMKCLRTSRGLLWTDVRSRHRMGRRFFLEVRSPEIIGKQTGRSYPKPEVLRLPPPVPPMVEIPETAFPARAEEKLSSIGIEGGIVNA